LINRKKGQGTKMSKRKDYFLKKRDKGRKDETGYVKN
jgi:hypothetical protein